MTCVHSRPLAPYFLIKRRNEGSSKHEIRTLQKAKCVFFFFLLDSGHSLNPKENFEERSENQIPTTTSATKLLLGFSNASNPYLFKGCSNRHSWVFTSRTIPYPYSSLEAGSDICTFNA